MRRHRRAKIVATIGPASASPEMLKRLFLAGADTFRLNFSHGTHEDHARVHRAIRRLETDIGRPIGILQDLQGPKIRVGVVPDGAHPLRVGRHKGRACPRPSASWLSVSPAVPPDSGNSASPPPCSLLRAQAVADHSYTSSLRAYTSSLRANVDHTTRPLCARSQAHPGGSLRALTSLKKFMGRRRRHYHPMCKPYRSDFPGIIGP
jgi:hypothetical protein